MLLGDARHGKLAPNIVGFGRTLRRAGVRTDSARIALAIEAAQLVGFERKGDFSAALEAVLISREQDRLIFRELFDAFFRDPEVANKLLSQMLPSAEGKAEASKKRPRVREALSPQQGYGQTKPAAPDKEVDFDAAMTASDAQRLRHADFNALGASEYQLVERLVRDVALPLPELPGRRTQAGIRGARIHWHRALRRCAHMDGELLTLPRLTPRRQPLPLLVLVDVSGSMERYARLLLAFLHAATRQCKRRDVFAFGTGLTDLSSAFRCADTDDMLLHASAQIKDFAGGTRLGHSLNELRQQHARRLTGRRTVVLVISDGLDTGEPAQLDEALLWLKRHTRSLLWLNPLLRFEGYSPLARGATVLNRHADGMLAIHNLSKLESLAEALSALLRR